MCGVMDTISEIERVATAAEQTRCLRILNEHCAALLTQAKEVLADGDYEFADRLKDEADAMQWAMRQIQT